MNQYLDVVFSNMSTEEKEMVERSIKLLNTSMKKTSKCCTSLEEDLLNEGICVKGNLGRFYYWLYYVWLCPAIVDFAKLIDTFEVYLPEEGETWFLNQIYMITQGLNSCTSSL